MIVVTGPIVLEVTAMTKLVLYSYFRSSCSWRVRIALNLKGIAYEQRAVNLLKGDQLSDEYLRVNPMGQVPALKVGNTLLTQSLAIIEYLEENFPKPALLPKDSIERAQVRGLAETIASGIQPIQNLAVLKYVGDERKSEWGKHFIEVGFDALETQLAPLAGKYCFGDSVTLADLCLVPQVVNANRFKVDMSRYPIISRVNDNLMELDAFKESHPFRQDDCPEELRQK